MGFTKSELEELWFDVKTTFTYSIIIIVFLLGVWKLIELVLE